jgi:hypothetical protein
MPPDKSLFEEGQLGDREGMKRAPPVTPVQWLAVLAVWGLVAYGALASPKQETRRDQVHLIACR